MIFIPFSTDVHDGRIRLAAIEIIGLCLLVHIFVSSNASRVELRVAAEIAQWQKEQVTNLENGSSQSTADGIKEIEQMMQCIVGGTVPNGSDELERRIIAVRKTALTYRLGLVLSNFRLHTLFTSMFTHGGWLHLLGNMIFFYVCGVAMEQYWGFWRFMVIYLVCGLLAHGAFALMAVASNTFSNDIPLVGASGAIAGIMGAFLVTHTKSKVKLFYWFGFRAGVLALPAYLFFGFWFIEQVFYMLLHASSTDVAYTAHVGGFLAGALLGKVIKSEDDASIVSLELAHHQKSLPSQNSNLSGSFYYIPPSQERVLDESEQKCDDTPSVTTAEKAGMAALYKGDVVEARLQFGSAMHSALQHFDQFRSGFAHLFGTVVKERERVQFSQNEYYQWGKSLSQLKEYRYAIICFDLAALCDERPHLQKNSMIEAARLRIKTSYQTDKAKRDLEYLLSVDPDGITSSTVKEVLKELGSAGYR